MPQPSILDARLAEIDRRLRTIQSELLTTGTSAEGEASGSGPKLGAAAPVTPLRAAPPSPPLSPPPPPLSPSAAADPPSALHEELAEAGRLVAQLRNLAGAHERLLASSQELLTAFADALATSTARGSTVTDAADPPPRAVAITAGPFADTTAVRRFEQSLTALPEVREVTVREYTGTDRVVVDVLLSGATS